MCLCDKRSSIASLFSFCALIACLLIAHVPCRGQGGDATLGGLVTDTSGAIVQDVAVRVTNIDKGTTHDARSNSSGLFNVSGLNPGRYSVHVEHPGFADVEIADITLNVEDNRQLQIELKPGEATEVVTVSGEGATINTTDATVGTVIDRQFVEEIPLNGRSFQDLVLLSPGVVTGSPQGNDYSGDYSINGQRTSGNNFKLDGVTAMNPANSPFASASSSGSASNSTALGTTQAIISIDALQEFRIATTTYPAEFGPQPGAQISFTSRSGTNEYHGTAFEYLRNYAFDANDWFNNYSTPALPRPQERQNDFGGVIGGPISIPKVFSGRDRAFWFFSYEGLRLQQPVPSTIGYVPSNGTFNTATNYAKTTYKNLRANAPASEQAMLNGWPLPNCSTAQNAQCIDFGDGLSPFLFSTTTPASIDSILGRVDFQPLPWMHVFARYNDTESSSMGLFNLTINSTVSRIRAYLLGVDSVIHGSLANELRLQYSPAYEDGASTAQVLGGETSVTGQQGPNLNTMQGMSPSGGKTGIHLEKFAGGEATQEVTQSSNGGRQFQPEVADTISWTHGRHNFKGGVDYRQTKAYFGDGYLSYGPITYYIFETAAQVIANSTDEIETTNLLRQDPLTKNLGVFFQDQWRVKPRLSLSLGLRWDLNPPMTISGAQQYTYTGNVNDPSSVALSALGAPFYKTTYTDFGPRVGFAYVIHDQPGHELVLRAGGGLFYDTGQSADVGAVADGVNLGASREQVLKKTAFPLPASTILAPFSTTPTPPYTLTYVLDPHFIPPSTVEWSASLEQALGSAQSVIIGYVGTEGRNLTELAEYSLTASNPLFTTIKQYQNGPGSIYNALQAQYKRKMAHGLQVLASYTWAHAIDSASTDYSAVGILTPQRGNSDHDVRNKFNTALVYNTPTQYSERWARALLGNWGLDLSFVARSAFPVRPLGPTVIDPQTGDDYPTRLNYNGKNVYVHVAGIPGGRQFDPTAFSIPATGQVGTAPRNFLRGFGENASNLAVQRSFPLYERAKLQFRTEAFNVFNRPNFGRLNISCGSTTAGATCNNPLMGQATATLANSGATQLSSSYAQGGPRSLQFALKIQF